MPTTEESADEARTPDGLTQQQSDKVCPMADLSLITTKRAVHFLLRT